MARTRVKICGITRPEDAALAAELGADYLGLNFFSGPRKINFAQGEAILQRVPSRVSAVGLFWCNEPPVSPTGESRWYCLNHLSLRQVYGLFDELAATAQAFDGAVDRKNAWVPVSIGARDGISRLRHIFEMTRVQAGGLLLDTAASGKLGGTGQTFNWQWIAEAREAGELEGLPPIILAGGLTPDNVAEAIRMARPYAVDVSSGVEVAGKPGVKDPVKMRDFIQAARGA